MAGTPTIMAHTRSRERGTASPGDPSTGSTWSYGDGRAAPGACFWISGTAAPRRPNPECARVAAGLISLFFLPETAMTEVPVDSAARIGRLERDIRRMRIGIVGGLGLVTAFA